MLNHNQKILFCVTGMSPAVVTETLYALTQKKEFIPDAIYVATTAQGKNTLMRDLLGIEGGRHISDGAFHRFCEEYQLSQIIFDESHIHVITDDNGIALADIQTPEQNVCAADTIVRMISRFCHDDRCVALHVSIAGGRKTMGFFAGYALSLYGRAQDSLSHVLVSAEYEAIQNFFYPTKTDEFLIDRYGKEVNAKDAEVMLAEIPWVRLGVGLPTTLLNNDISYSESIRLAQASIETPSLSFLSEMNSDQVVKCGSEQIHFPPKAYAFLFLAAVYCKKGHSLNLTKWEQVKQNYLTIYSYFFGATKTGNLDKRMCDIDDVRSVISESRNEIKKSLQRIFGTIPNSHHYLPQAESSKGYCYHLNIDPNHIIFSEDENALIEKIAL
ncbi:CRISPR-associated ring nuclease Csm6 [Gallibacterium anatis]